MPAEQPLVLVVEDDSHLRQYLVTTLRSTGSAWPRPPPGGGPQPRRPARAGRDAAGPGLPDGDGLSLARELRAVSRSPSSW